MSNHYPTRRSVRLPTFDYSGVGCYFVTVCIANRTPLLGAVEDAAMRHSDIGLNVQSCWTAILEHFPQVQLDAFVVMPNHVHGVLLIGTAEEAGAACRAPTENPRQFGPPDRSSLSTVIRSFKSASTRRVNLLRNTPGAPLWQRNYYEHIVRNDDDLVAIRQYIADNPAQWALDEENPARDAILRGGKNM